MSHDHVIKTHHKWISLAWDMLTIFQKRKFSRNGPYERIKIARIGVQSGNAAVYKLGTDGVWVAKVSVVNMFDKAIYAKNNQFVNWVLKHLQDAINHQTDIAKIAVSDTVVHLQCGQDKVVVTFEKMLKGMSLTEFINQPQSDGADDIMQEHLPKILDSIKKTLKYLHDITITTSDGVSAKLQFSHNDLHCGNVMIEHGTLRPIIIDFDWSSFACDPRVFAQYTTDRKYDYTQMLRMLCDTFEMHVKGSRINPQTFRQALDAQEPAIIDTCQRNRTERGWIHVNVMYSLLAYYMYLNTDQPIPTDVKEHMINKVDLAMLVNSFILMTCDVNRDVIPVWVASILRDIDNKIRLDTDVTFSS